MENLFHENPPLLYGEKLNMDKHETWLGEEIGGSLTDCITLTLNKRIPLIRKAIFEIKHVIEDCRSRIVGGIQTGLLLWNSCLVPLLYNNGCRAERVTSIDLSGSRTSSSTYYLKVLVQPMKIL